MYIIYSIFVYGDARLVVNAAKQRKILVIYAIIAYSSMVVLWALNMCGYLLLRTVWELRENKKETEVKKAL